MTKICSGCGKDIPAGRLKALPNTRTCVECSSTDKFAGVITSVAERPGSEDVEVGLAIIKDPKSMGQGRIQDPLAGETPEES